MDMLKKILFMLTVGSIALTSLSSCSRQQEVQLHMMPLGEMPAMVQSAPRAVQEAYQFAAANPEVTEAIPCYCGCYKIGHQSSYDCYVSNVDSQGAISFDNHAVGCSICVEITQDTMKLLRAGKNIPEIKTYVDETYAKYGAPTAP